MNSRKQCSAAARLDANVLCLAVSSGDLGACRAWDAESENWPQRGQFLPGLQSHSPAMGQKDGEKWTAAANLQPALPKSDRLLGQVLFALDLGTDPCALGDDGRAAIHWAAELGHAELLAVLLDVPGVPAPPRALPGAEPPIPPAPQQASARPISHVCSLM